jgi:hypothetical protein
MNWSADALHARLVPAKLWEETEFFENENSLISFYTEYIGKVIEHKYK